jgi:hypothetical protein
MNIKENITLYICDHCNKRYEIKKACEKHESVCLKNPKNWRTCFRCKHFEKKEVDVYFSQPWASTDAIYKRKINFCNLKKIGLVPPLTTKEPYDLIGFENEEMPKKCEIFEPITYNLPF